MGEFFRKPSTPWLIVWLILLGWAVFVQAQTANIGNTSNVPTLTSGSTGSGAVVYQNTPTLITPVLGLATGTSVIVTDVLTAGAGSYVGWTGRSKLSSTADGNVVITNAAGTGTGNITLILGPAGGDAKSVALLMLYQTNPVLYLRDAAGGQTANLVIEAQKSASGVRFVCINTAGQLVSQVAACVGT